MQSKKIETIKRGEYIKRSETARTVYIRGSYDQSRKRYSLTDASDISREVFIKKGSSIFIGFTY